MRLHATDYLPPYQFEMEVRVQVPTHSQIFLENNPRIRARRLDNWNHIRQYSHMKRYNPQVIEHDEDDYTGLEDPNDFLDRAHPENDAYMRSVDHVQRQIMHATTMLRAKQVQVLKSVFAGLNYTEAGAKHHMHASTVSRLVKSTNGQRLLNLLQYHLKLIEGPNEAQRRNMLWRIAAKEEQRDPKTSIKAIAELNKMHFQQQTIDNPQDAPAPKVVIQINQNQLPKTELDKI